MQRRDNRIQLMLHVTRVLHGAETPLLVSLPNNSSLIDTFLAISSHDSHHRIIKLSVHFSGTTSNYNQNNKTNYIKIISIN